jgi:hypothetical protein
LVFPAAEQGKLAEPYPKGLWFSCCCSTSRAIPMALVFLLLQGENQGPLR